MKKIIHVRIFKGDELYVAEAPDIGVVTQGSSLDQLAENLNEAIALALEGEDLAQMGFVDQPTILASLELESPPFHAKA